MIYIFLIVAYYFTNGNYGKHVIYGIKPEYQTDSKFNYPTECNQSITLNLQSVNDLDKIMNLDWYDNFHYWKNEYINRYYEDININKNEFDYFVNYVIKHNEFVNVSNNFYGKMKEIKQMDYLAELNEKDYIHFFNPDEDIIIHNKINKAKYDNIKMNYDLIYLNNYFENNGKQNGQTMIYENIYEIWKCSIHNS